MDNNEFVYDLINNTAIDMNESSFNTRLNASSTDAIDARRDPTVESKFCRFGGSTVDGV
ncbi:hypothetical protein L195_g060596, partial [Trifolium pratense]